MALMIVAALFAVPALLLAIYPFALQALARVRPFRVGAPSASYTADTSATPGTPGSHGRAPGADTSVPGPVRIGMVTVSNRLDERLEAKVREFLGHADRLDHGIEISELFIGFDGALPDGALPAPFDDARLQWVAVTPAQGKNVVLGRIHAAAEADILVFTDVDARVGESSLAALLGAFGGPPEGEAGETAGGPEVGAVTGRRVIVDDSRFGAAQAGYSALDSGIRSLEMRCFGSVTSCDGKLYAVRRSCVTPLPDSVTDDLHTGLGAVVEGQRLVFEPLAAALIGRPARDIGHELERRRRVTCRGLATLWHRRELLVPWRHGLFAIALFINKVLRRIAAPCALVALLLVVLVSLLDPASSTLPWLDVGLRAIVLGTFVLLAVIAAIAVVSGRKESLSYLLLGLVGMTLGVFDYLRGRRVSRWVPRKQAESSPAPAPLVDDTERP